VANNFLRFIPSLILSLIFYVHSAGADINDDKSILRSFNINLESFLSSLPEEDIKAGDLNSSNEKFQTLKSSYLLLNQVLRRLNSDSSIRLKLEEEITPFLLATDDYYNQIQKPDGAENSTLESLLDQAKYQYSLYSAKRSIEKIKQQQLIPQIDILRGQLPVFPASAADAALSDGNITPSYLSQTIEESKFYNPEIDAVISDKAHELDHDPVKIYQFVTQNIAPEFYPGHRKSPVAVLRSGSGNDVDQALLLAHLYIASGYQANPVTGIARVPAGYIETLSGLSGKSAIVKFLRNSGQQFFYYGFENGYDVYYWQRTWISARLPYNSYRGAVVNKNNQSWIPLDPFITVPPPLPPQLSRLPDNVKINTAMADYLSLDPAASNKSFVSYLTSLAGSETSDDETAIPEAEEITYLPASLFFDVERVITEGKLPEHYINQVTITATTEGNFFTKDILQQNLTISELYNHNITFSFEAASREDQDQINLAGGLNNILLSDISLKLVIRVDDQIIAISDQSLTGGDKINLTFTLNDTNRTQFNKILVVGSYYSLAVGGGAVTSDPDQMTNWPAKGRGSHWLSHSAYQYQHATYTDNQALEILTGHKVLYPLPTFTFVSNRQQIDYLLDQPAFLSWTGVNMDALLQPTVSVPAPTSHLSTADFIKSSALNSSWHEQNTFEDVFSLDSVSADELLKIARKDGILILEKPTQADVENSSHSLAVISEIRELLNNGFDIYMPASPVTVNQWTGSSWIAIDPQTGASGYFLSGSIAGGTNTSTAGNSISWSLIDPTSSAPTEGEDKVAYLKAYYDGENIGIAGQETKIRIEAYSISWEPVVNANITLYIATANGIFDNGSGVHTLITDTSGSATATLTFATSTAITPHYMRINREDTYPQRVSEVSLNAMVGTEYSASGKVSLLSPISLFYGPDKAVRAQIDQIAVNMIRASAYDQYNNPVANIPVTIEADGYDCMFSNTSPDSEEGRVRTKYCAIADALIGDRGEGKVEQIRYYTTTEHSQMGFIKNGKYSSTYYAFNASVEGVLTRRFHIGIVGSGDAMTRQYQEIIANNYISFYERQRETIHCFSSPSTLYYGMSGSEDKYYILTKPGQTKENAIIIKPRLCMSTELIGTNADNKQGTLAFIYTPIEGPASVNITSSSGAISISNEADGIHTNYLIDVIGAATGRHPIAYGDDLQSFSEIARYYTVLPEIRQETTPAVQPRSGGQTITTEPVSVSYTLNQPGLVLGYLPYLLIYENDTLIGSYNSESYSESGSFTIPAGFALNTDSNYYLELVVYYGGKSEVRSDRIPLNLQLIADHTETIRINHISRPASNWSCPGSYNDLNVILTREADVSVSIAEIKSTETGVIESERTNIYSENLTTGRNVLELDLNQYPEGTYRLHISATSGSVTEERSTTLKIAVNTLESIPVSHSVYNNIDLYDGSLNLLHNDLSVPLETLSLNIARQYNSNQRSDKSYFGIGWSDPNLHVLTETACGTVTVKGIPFEPDGTDYKPVPGYHGTLIKSGDDYDFYTKGGVRYHFKHYPFLKNNQRLVAYIQPPAGAAIRFSYQTDSYDYPMIATLEDSYGRKLSYEYSSYKNPKTGLTAKRVSNIKFEGGNTASVDYTYDDEFRLTSATLNKAGSTITLNQYSYADPVYMNTKVTDDSNTIIDQTILLNTTSLSQITGVADALSHTTSYTYTELKVPDSKLSTLLSDGKAPFVTKIKDRNGNSTSLNYNFTQSEYNYDLGVIASEVAISGSDWNIKQRLNSYGAVLENENAAGTEYTNWDKQHLLPASITDRNENTTKYSYDNDGNETQKTYSHNNTEITEVKEYIALSTSYSGGKRVYKTALKSRTDGEGRTVTYTYGNQYCPFPTVQSYPKKNFKYDNYCRLSAEADANGNSFTYSYDSHGYKSNVDGPSSGIKKFTEKYKNNAFGEVITFTDSNDFVTSYMRNLYGQPLEVKQSLGKTTTYIYDAAGRNTQITDPLGRITTFTYDGEGRPISETRLRGCDGSDKAVTRAMSYTSRGSKLTETDWNDQKTEYKYDGDDRLIAVLSPRNKRITYTLDGNGNRTREIFTIQGTATGSIQRTFNNINQPETVTDAEGYVTTLTYDDAGNLINQNDANGLITEHKYDEYNRRIKTTRGSRTTDYTYDMNGRLLTETDAVKTIRHSWNALGHEIQTLVRSGSDRATTNRAYDPMGNVLSITDPVGDKTTYKYDPLYRRTSMVDGIGQTTTYTYDLADRMLSQTLPNGNGIQYKYDASDNRTEVRDNLGLSQQSIFDCQGNKTSTTDGNGNITRHEYNELNQRIKTTLPIGAELKFSFDHQENLLTETNALGHKRSFTYDKRSLVISETDFNGNRTNYVLDALGKPVSITDAAGNTTANTYNLFGELTKVKDPLNLTQSFSYDDVGHQISFVDRRGIITNTTYNNVLDKPTSSTRNNVLRWRKTYYPDGQLSAEYDALGNTTLHEYDALKRPTLISGESLAVTQYQYSSRPTTRTIISPDSARTLETYDVRDQLLSVNQAGAVTEYTYDLSGNRLSLTLPASQQTLYNYDALNRMTGVTEADGSETTFVYDDAGRKTTHTDAARRTTSFTYDNNGNLLSVNYAGQLTTSFTYDALNQVTLLSRPAGNIQYGYDALGRRTSQSDSTGNIQWSYDGNSNLTSTRYSYNNALISGGTVTASYDSLDRRISMTDIAGLQTQWRYDNNNLPVAITYPNGNTAQYMFDNRNRLASLITPKGAASLSYYPDDQLKSIDYANGAASLYEYTQRNQVSRIKHTLNGGIIAGLSYDYDANDNRTREGKDLGTGAAITSYVYDELNQLSKVIYPAQYGVAGKTVEYTYDSTHNRTEESITTQDSASVTRTYTYNNLDQLTRISSTDSHQTQIDYSYDSSGNLSAKTTSITTDKGTQSTTLNYTFDARNELQQVTRGGSTIGQFLYDSSGQRIRAKFQQNDGAPLAYQHSLYQGLNLISQYDVGSNNALSINANYQFNPLQRQFIGREAFAESNSDNNTQTYYHTDALGSVLATSKRTQTIAARYDYDAWGNEVNNTDTSDNPLGYTGHQMDRDIGLIYANARYLDSDTGRFLSFDPFEGYDDKPISLNKYLYAYQNPLKYTDPDGREPAEKFALDAGRQVITNAAGQITTISGMEAANAGAYATATSIGSKVLAATSATFGVVTGWLYSPALTDSTLTEQQRQQQMEEFLAQRREREIFKKNNPGVLDARGGNGAHADSTMITVESTASLNASQRRSSDPVGTKRNSAGRLIDANTGKYVRDPNTHEGEKTTSNKLRSAQQARFNQNRPTALQQNEGVCEYCQQNPSTQVDHLESIKSFADKVDAEEITFEEAVDAASSPENLVGRCGGGGASGVCNQIKGAKPVSLDAGDTNTYTPSNPSDRVKNLLEKKQKLDDYE